MNLVLTQKQKEKISAHRQSTSKQTVTEAQESLRKENILPFKHVSKSFPLNSKLLIFIEIHVTADRAIFLNYR